MKKIRLFWRLSAAGKWIFFEVFISSIYTSFLLHNDGLYKKTGFIFNISLTKNTPAGRSGPYQQKTIQLISSAIQSIAKYTPWRNVCYHQVLQARLLLNRRGIPSEIYIGFRKNDQEKIEGHAWSISCGKMVTGFCNPNEYTVFATF